MALRQGMAMQDPRFAPRGPQAFQQQDMRAGNVLPARQPMIPAQGGGDPRQYGAGGGTVAGPGGMAGPPGQPAPMPRPGFHGGSRRMGHPGMAQGRQAPGMAPRGPQQFGQGGGPGSQMAPRGPQQFGQQQDMTTRPAPGGGYGHPGMAPMGPQGFNPWAGGQAMGQQMGSTGMMGPQGPGGSGGGNPLQALMSGFGNIFG